jgi:hypothetical protein
MSVAGVRWERQFCDDGSGEWIEARTAAGDWAISEKPKPWGGFIVIWYPPVARCGEVEVGQFKTQAAAKRGAKRHAKALAAAFQSFAKAGWQ